MMLAVNEKSPGAGGTEALNEAGHFDSRDIAPGASAPPSNSAMTFLAKLHRYRTARATYHVEIARVQEEFTRTGDVESEEEVNRLCCLHGKALIDVLLCPAHTIEQLGSKIEIIVEEEVLDAYTQWEEVAFALLADKRRLIGKPYTAG